MNAYLKATNLSLVTALVVGLTACASSGPRYAGSYGQESSRSYYRCERCGQVIRIEQYYQDGRSSGGGAVAGAIIGGVLGNQVGSGDGRKAATAAGAIAGGVAGNAIERNAREGMRYEVHVALDNGRREIVHQRDLNGVYEGARVSLRNGRVRLL